MTLNTKLMNLATAGPQDNVPPSIPPFHQRINTSELIASRPTGALRVFLSPSSLVLLNSVHILVAIRRDFPPRSNQLHKLYIVGGRGLAFLTKSL